MKLNRIKSKGKRWEKHNSCASNPSSSKFRDAAKGRFFQKLEGESVLTESALAKHNEDLMQVSQRLQNLDVEEDDLKSGGHTFRTFATNYTTCTISAFNNFFQKFDVKSDLHTRMLAIHAAVQEYMREHEMSETPTAYMCSLVVSLEGIIETEEDTAACLSLLARVIRLVPVTVLRSRYTLLTNTLDMALVKYSEGSNVRIVMNCIGCLSVLLRSLRRDDWEAEVTRKLLSKMLEFTLHSKPKIRKSAQYNVSMILRASSFMLSKDEENKVENSQEVVAEMAKTYEIHPCSAEVSEFAQRCLREAAEMGNTKSTLHMLVFFRQIIMCFPKKQLKLSCESILSVMQLGNVLINTCAMQALQQIFAHDPPPSVLPLDTNIALFNAFTAITKATIGRFSIIPSINDPKLCSAWIPLVTAIVKRMYLTDKNVGCKYMAIWFHKLIHYWKSDHSTIFKLVYDSMEELLDDCFTGENGDILRENSHIQDLFSAVEESISFQYQPAWEYIFKIIGVCFTVFGPHSLGSSTSCLKNLCGLYNNPDIPSKGELEHAIGMAIKSLGPEPLLSIVPFQVSGNIEDDEKFFWVLPLFRRYIHKTSLCFFERHFVLLANKCFVILESLKKSGNESLLYKTYKTIEEQIWAMLPSFAKEAVDTELALSNEKFAKLLCEHIKFRDDTRIDVMAALRHMVESNESPDSRLVLYARNYLPALFNVYLTKPYNFQANSREVSQASAGGIDPGHRLAAYETVSAYLTIVPSPKCAEFIAIILSKYKNESDPFKKQALFELVKPFIPYISKNDITSVYECIIPYLKINRVGSSKLKDKLLQKTSYRLIEAIMSCSTEAGLEFIHDHLESLSDILVTSLSSTRPNARALRLKCLRGLLLALHGKTDPEKMDSFIRQVVTEAVLCCGGGNNSINSRKAAFLLLSELGSSVQQWKQCSPEETVRYCLQYLLAGMVATPLVVSNTVLALASFVYQYQEAFKSDTLALLLHNVCVQMERPTREIVNACLSFVKSVLKAFPVSILSDHVDAIVSAVCAMNDDCQRKYRMKTRDIFSVLFRKFGHERIIALVPQEKHILHKRLINLRKIEAKKKRETEVKRKSTAPDEDMETTDHVPASIDEILAEIDDDMEKDLDEEEDPREEHGRGKHSAKKKKKQVIFIKDDGDIVDLLHPSAGQAVVSKRPILKAPGGVTSREARETHRGHGGFRVDRVTGKLIITEEKESTRKPKKVEFIDDFDKLLGMRDEALAGKIRNRKRKLSEDLDDAEEVEDDDLVVEEASEEPRRKRPKGGAFNYGAEYRSKKARGDVTRKGKPTPYAYVQLSRERLNRRKRAKFAGQFKSLVRGARKGVSSGRKMKTRGGRRK